MDFSRFVQKFELPDGFAAPTELHYEHLVARPLTRNDLEDDLEGVNSSIEIIQRTRGGGWPEEPLQADFDLLDLAWHEREFRDASSFAYVVYDTDDGYVGCFYLYPMGQRTILTEENRRHDVDVSWWVTTEAYGRGEYGVAFAALKQWLAHDFPFQNPYYSNKEIPA